MGLPYICHGGRQFGRTDLSLYIQFFLVFFVGEGGVGLYACHDQTGDLAFDFFIVETWPIKVSPRKHEIHVQVCMLTHEFLSFFLAVL